jgi:hypothetical protein
MNDCKDFLRAVRLLMLPVAMVLELSAVALADEAGKTTDAGPPARTISADPLPNCKASVVINQQDFLKDFNQEETWPAFQATVKKFIESIECEFHGNAFKPWSRDTTFLVRFSDGDKAYHRAVVNREIEGDFQGRRLIGSDVYDLQLWEEKSSPKTTYAGVPVPNPIIGSLQKAVSVLVGGWGKATVLQPVRGPKVEKTVFRLFKLKVPPALSRAMITVKEVVSKEEKNAEETIFSDKYYLAPSTKVELGLGAALILGTSLNQQVKVDSSKNLVDDTPSTLLTYVGVNWRPWGFDESTAAPRFREAVRVVIGPALTPNPGVVVGVGLSPFWWPAFRSFSLQGGYGVLLSNVLRTGDTLGAPPGSSGRPTRRGALGVWFVGIGYGL